MDRAGAAPEEEDERTDVYFVVPGRTDASVKLRGGALDLKLLRAVAGDLEQWDPAARAELPVPADRLAEEFLRPAGIGLDPGPGPVDRERLLRLVADRPGLRMVEVAKRRRRWRLDGARAELARLRVGGRVTESVAVEEADPAAVERVRGRLGLAGGRNVSYQRLLVEDAFGA